MGAGQGEMGIGRPKVGKKSSLMGLRGSSPLSQPPINTDTTLDGATGTGLTRRRSKSMSSTQALIPSADSTAAASTSASNTGTFSRKRRGLFSRRKSISSASDLSSLSSLPADSALLASGSSTPSGSFTDVSKLPSLMPGSMAGQGQCQGRKSFNADSGSTCSTASSSEGPRTPGDSPMLRPADAGASKAKAGAAIEREGKEAAAGGKEKRGFMSLFGRRSSSMLAVSTLASGVSSISPNSSTADLTAKAAAASASTPSSSVDINRTSSPPASYGIGAAPVSRITPTPEQRTLAATSDFMRRTTFRKLSQLRRPSPHPLAAHLRRQYSHLPNEVIASLEASQTVYPRSVNWYVPSGTIGTEGPGSGSGTGPGLAPAQGGLWTTLAVKIVLDKLDDGHLPDGAFTRKAVLTGAEAAAAAAATNLASSATGTAGERSRRSMADFVTRLPFEERHVVFYPDGAWSPVSMARRGFAVWDLDYSGYVLAMADIGREGGSLPSLASMGSLHAALIPGGVEVGREAFEVDDAAVQGQVILSPVMASFPLDVAAITARAAIPSSVPDTSAAPAISTFASALISSETAMSRSASGSGSASNDEDSDEDKGDILITPPAELFLGRGVPEIRIADDGEGSDVGGGLMQEIQAIGRFITTDQTHRASAISSGSEKEGISRSVSADCLAVGIGAADSALSEEDEDEDDVPLSKSRIVLRKASMPMLGSTPFHPSSGDKRHSRQASTPSARPPSSGTPPLPHSTSTPRIAGPSARTSSSNRLSSMADPESAARAKERALAEVARARERRRQLETGEVDRLAEGEKRRLEEGKRRSTMNLAQLARPSSQVQLSSKTTRPSSLATAPTPTRQDRGRGENDEARRRTQSASAKGKRYHSFYDAPAAGAKEVQSQAQAQAQVLKPNMTGPQSSRSPQREQGRTVSMFNMPPVPHMPAMPAMPAMMSPMQMQMGMGMPMSQMGMYPQPYSYQQQRPISMMSSGGPVPVPVMPLSLQYQQQQQQQQQGYFSPVSMAQHFHAASHKRHVSPSGSPGVKTLGKSRSGQAASAVRGTSYGNGSGQLGGRPGMVHSATMASMDTARSTPKRRAQ